MKILTAAVNNPGFLEMQSKSITKHVNSVSGGENISLIVFNDAKNWSNYTNFYKPEKINKNMIDMVCHNRLNKTCIDVSNDSSQSAQTLQTRYATVLNTMMTYMISNPDKYLVIDSDMVFVDDIDLTQFNSNYFGYVDIAGAPSPNFFFIDTANLSSKESINWDITTPANDTTWLTILKTDVANSGKIFEFSYLPSLTWNASDLPNNINSNLLTFLNYDFRNMGGHFFSEIYSNFVFHYKAGSNWMCEDLIPCNPYITNMLMFNVRLTNQLKLALTQMNAI